MGAGREECLEGEMGGGREGEGVYHSIVFQSNNNIYVRMTTMRRDSQVQGQNAVELRNLE